MVKLVSNAPNLDDIASFTVSGAAADFVYRQGEAGKEMYLIQDGRIELLNQDGGQQRQLEVLEAGDFFGELSLLEDERRDGSARAVTPYRLLRIDRATLQQLVQENPDIAVKMLHRLASRLRKQEERLRAATNSSKPAESLAPPPKRAPAPAPQAAVLIHNDSAKEFPLGAGEAIVGRVDRATGFTPDVNLTPLDTDRSLSRRHATITRRDDAYYLSESAATRNGTFVNGHRVTTGVDVKLNDGDSVRFGLIETTFHHR